jgi:hypothetical protein
MRKPLLAVLGAGVLVAVACSLNPQPLPPESSFGGAPEEPDASHENDASAAQGGSSSGGSSGTTSGPDSGQDATGQPPPSDGGADAPSDAPADAPTDAEDAG